MVRTVVADVEDTPHRYWCVSAPRERRHERDGASPQSGRFGIGTFVTVGRDAVGLASGAWWPADAGSTAMALPAQERCAMTRVLVVHHDIDLADQEVDSLRAAGFEVEQCSGPTAAVMPCPVLRGLPCGAAERADVLVYDVWSMTESDGGRQLINHLRELYPDIPVVLTAPGMELDWVEEEGPHRVTPLVGVATRERLVAAISAALAAPPAAG